MLLSFDVFTVTVFEIKMIMFVFFLMTLKISLPLYTSFIHDFSDEWLYFLLFIITASLQYPTNLCT